MIVNRWVAVLGGAGRYDDAQLFAAYRCGIELARRGKHLLTGATTGIPFAAALGVKDAGGLVVGISPAASCCEHVTRYEKPLSPADLVIFSAMTLDGRAPLILRSAGAAIFIGGEMGTLAEFAAGWLCGCPYLGLLEICGGISSELRQLSASMQNWGSTVIAKDDPIELVEAICTLLDSAEEPAWRNHEEKGVGDVLRSLEAVRP
jgi:uncharacterized protein (TIGR00725 family)